MKNKIDKPAIYAGIEGITEEQNEILMMNPNHRIYPRLNIEDFDTEVEKAVTKANWEKLRKERKKEEDNIAIETGESKEDLKTFDESKKVIDFRNLKATDLKNNKRIYIVKMTDEQEEIRMNMVKTELKGVFKKICEGSL